ncbi:MAG: permease of the major facilitator superfamily [Bradyrhizobium sp.]|nr:permease of the major facilitator superfamily [Bradyrhizobium sp.]
MVDMGASIGSGASASARPLLREQWRTVILASVGGSLEFYDFVIYGIFAQYISKQFFPVDDP